MLQASILHSFLSHEEWAVQRSTFSDLMPSRSYRKAETCNESCLHSKLRTTHVFADGKRLGTTARAADRHVHEKVTAKSLLHKANKAESQDAPKPHCKVLKPKTCVKNVLGKPWSGRRTWVLYPNSSCGTGEMTPRDQRSGWSTPKWGSSFWRCSLLEMSGELWITTITGCLQMTWDFIRANNHGKKNAPRRALQIQSVEILPKVSQLKQMMCGHLTRSK